MKYAAAVLILLLFSANLLQAQDHPPAEQEVIALSEPVEETDHYRVFGTPFEGEGTVLTIEAITAEAEQYDGEQVVTEGTIVEVCMKKGCFFMLETDAGEVRITFRDYSFFIPTNSAGKKVVVEGLFTIAELTEEQAVHYAEDAGKDGSDIAGPQREFALDATSVKIVDVPSE